jgi:hypothetical protein
MDEIWTLVFFNEIFQIFVLQLKNSSCEFCINKTRKIHNIEVVSPFTFATVFFQFS